MRLPIVLALACCVISGSALALDKTSAVNKGAKLLTGPEKASLFPGKTFKGSSYSPDGKKVATWSVKYAKDGTKTTTVNGKKIDRKWWVDGNKFCEQLASSGKTTCDDGPNKLGSKCYTFHSNGAIQNEMGC